MAVSSGYSSSVSGDGPTGAKHGLSSTGLFDAIPGSLGSPSVEKRKRKPKDFKCKAFCGKPNCTKAYTGEKALRAHEEGEVKNRFVCKELDCGKSFPRPEKLEEHAEWHTLPNGFECKELDCGKSYETKIRLQEHVEMHLQPGAQFVCGEEGCTRGFSTRATLRDHEERCGEGGHSCEWAGCPRTFSSAYHRRPSLSSRLLCALHSRLEYLHANEPWPGCSNEHYCTECEKDERFTQAGFDGPPDADGISLPNELCANHAREAGTKCSLRAGASHAACDAYHVLELVLKTIFPNLAIGQGEHVHFGQGEDPTGHELTPFANVRIGVDGTFRDIHGSIIAFYQFHGNYYHGFPPDHPRHLTFGCGHRWGPSLYNKTMDRDFQYKTEPMWDGQKRVEAPLFEVWECDFTAYKKAPKTGDATLKFHRHDRCASMTQADMLSMGEAMRVSEASEPDGEHTHGGPCGLCRDTRDAVK